MHYFQSWAMLKFNRFHATVKLSLFISKQCIINQFLDLVFIIYIWNNQGQGKCYQPSPLARPITLTSTLIILDITKTSSNNCLYIDLAKAKCEAVILYTFNYLKPKKLKRISFNLSKPKNLY